MLNFVKNPSMAVLDKMADDLGMYRFSEFVKDPDKYRTRMDNILELASHGSDTLRNSIDQYEFQFDIWKTDKLERLEDIVLGQGYQLNEVEFKPRVEQSDRGNGRYKIVVEFVIKKGKDANDKKLLRGVNF